MPKVHTRARQPNSLAADRHPGHESPEPAAPGSGPGPRSPRQPAPDALATARGWPDYPLRWVLLAAAAVGAVVTLALRIDPYLNPDSRAFEAIARSLLAGHGFVYREPMFPNLPLFAFRSPGYATFLALGLLIGGSTGAVALQGALNGVTAALVGAIAGRIAGVRAAWIAFALRLLWPAGWFYGSQLMSEVPFEFATVLAVWLAMLVVERRHLGWAIVTGGVIAAAALTRTVGVGCAVALGVWMLTRFPRGAVVMALAALVFWAPWPIRNAIRLHAFVPFVTNGGATLWSGHLREPPIVPWTYMAEHTEMGEVGLDRHLTATTLQQVRRNPAELARHILRGVISYLGPIRNRSRGVWLHRFAMLAALPALLLAGWRRRLTLPALVWIGEGVLLLAIATDSRYRFTTEWCVVVAAAVGLEASTRMWGARRVAGLSAAALLACIVFTLVVARG